MNEPATIHTDGACSGNPGPGGFAAIIEVGEHGESRFTVTGGDPDTTNNRMELSAVTEAVRLLNSQSDLRHSHLIIYSDSQYIVNAFNDNWIESWKRKGWRTAKKQPVANKDLWEALLRELSPHPTKFVWVKGHSGDPMNEECDRLAVEQAKIAPSQPSYWTSAGNPLSTVSGPEKPVTALSTLDPALNRALNLALERNQIALKSVKRAANLRDQGDYRDQAKDLLRSALKHMDTQKEIIQNADDNYPLSRAIAQDQNAKALQSVRRSLLMLEQRHDEAFIKAELTAAADILTSQHQTLTNAINDSDNCQGNTTREKAQDIAEDTAGDAEHLIDHTAHAIDDAIASMRRGQSWKAANTLELALQQLELHRKLRDQQANASPDDLPF